MGKASKWIRNFLVGKKEEKNKNQDSISSSTTKANWQTERRRWSFGRSAGVESSNFVLKSLKSFDSIVNSHKLTKALLEYKDDDQQHQQIESAKEIVAVKSTKSARQGPADLDAAATKIQAVFRSYLARRALHALRGLVKLQALVRGHLVRKRTTATLRCMHALISIQVRARVQRIRMADESQTHFKDRTAQRALVQHKQPYIAKEEVNISEKGAFFKNKTSSGYHPNSRRNEPVLLHYSPRGPISEQDLQLRTSTTPSTSSSTCSRQNTPTTKTNQNLVAPFSIPLSMSYTDHLANQYPWKPSYMANTQSSRAKSRSQSEPRQRPKGSIKQKSRRSISNELLDFTPDILLKCSSPNVRANGHKNQHPWLMKLYRSTKGVMKESECDNICVTSNGSNCKSVLVYEPPVNLY